MDLGKNYRSTEITNPGGSPSPSLQTPPIFHCVWVVYHFILHKMGVVNYEF